ncbi:Pre-mRNA-splicing factor 18 [Rhodotorula toruloides]|uniref:Pre-mRNA-splicing factor 18 n=1 Tax=Rhodotorula toruloides TaxID=5286 RepID=A0A0K3CQV4_RHOTO|nr:Pre-mRNA-splicing factor 18 [Rhodotorula toruloides]
MDWLKQEIASKKRQLESLSPSPSPHPTDSAASTSTEPPKKYLKRSEIERLREEEQARERELREKERREKLYGTASSARAGEKREGSVGAGGTPKRARSTSATPDPASLSTKHHAAAGEAFNISNDEAIRRLRQKGQPIRLFGESDKDRRLRLRALELLDAEREGPIGQRNEFQRALENKEKEAELEEIARRGGGGTKVDALKKKGRENGSASATPEPSASKDVSRSATPAQAGSAAEDGGESGLDKKEPNPKDEDVLVDLDLVRTNPHKVYPQIYHALKRVLKEWEQSLADRPESVKRSAQGKIAAATQATSAEYLKPLFKSLRKRELEADVLRNIAEITHYMQTREYLRANDAYLRLSIGNAPWPIGVTMVGIHERSGREKIFSNNVAHVLNDETSRKYIQSLKRLLTFAQAVRPPDDVSQKMG